MLMTNAVYANSAALQKRENGVEKITLWRHGIPQQEAILKNAAKLPSQTGPSIMSNEGDNMRALFTWELGNNIGHLTHIMNVSKKLSEQGWEIFFALKNPIALKNFNIEFPYKVLQAPHQPPAQVSSEPLTYAEDLIGCGYENTENLKALIKCWLDIFDIVNPDAIISEASPTALLAGKACGLTTFSFGSGFNVPPLTTPMQSLQHWENYTSAFLLERETKILSNINAALKELGFSGFCSVADALECNKRFICTVTELDHYPSKHRDRSRTEYFGPFFKTDVGKEYKWKKDKLKRIFVYLQPHSHAFQACLDALCKLPANYDSIIAAPGLPQEMSDKLDNSNLRISNEIVKLDTLLENCDLAITHGSQGITSAFVLHGIPVLMCPNHIEQLMFAKAVDNIDVGQIASLPYASDDIEKRIKDIFGDDEIKKNNVKMSEKYKDYNVEKQAEKIAVEIDTQTSLQKSYK